MFRKLLIFSLSFIFTKPVFCMDLGTSNFLDAALENYYRRTADISLETRNKIVNVVLAIEGIFIATIIYRKLKHKKKPTGIDHELSLAEAALKKSTDLTPNIIKIPLADNGQVGPILQYFPKEEQIISEQNAKNNYVKSELKKSNNQNDRSVKLYAELRKLREEYPSKFLKTSHSNYDGLSTMDGNTAALICEASKENKEKLQLLLKKGADFSAALTWAVTEGKTAIVRTLLDNRANVNSKLTNGLALLSMAIKCGHTEIVDLLTNSGAI